MCVTELKVLIVDDSATIRVRLAGLLAEIEKVEVVGEAANAREGLELARSLRPDVVTLDVRMPGQSGLEVISRIKQLQPSPTVIVLTNFPYPAYRNRALELGADFFFDKTTELHEVVEVVGNAGGDCRGVSGEQKCS